MNGFNKEEDKKKGFLPFLSRLFGGGSKGAYTAGKAVGTGAGMFSKAGILGVVLGGATIAAGVGVIYNFISPSSGKVYSPDLFQNAYYQEQAKKASIEREGVRDMSSQSASSIDMFREQAKKEGLGMDEKAAEEEKAQAGASSEAPDAAAPSAEGAGSGGKLNANLGFNSGKGGSGSMNKLQTSGGMFGGIGKQFAPVNRSGSANLADSGKAKNMKGALASNVKNSPKYTVPNIKKSGAFGQAKYSGKVGQKAAFNASDSGSRSAAEAAFSGETAGSGDVATPAGGTGVGGAGLSDSAKLKSNDPNINNNEYEPPTPAGKENDNPWQEMEDAALYGMLAAAGLILLTKLFASAAKKAIGTPAFAYWYYAAYTCAVLAMVAAGVVLAAAVGFMMGRNFITGEGPDDGMTRQTYTGAMYAIAGGALMYYAYEALSSLGELSTANSNADFAKGIQDTSQQQAFKAAPSETQTAIREGGIGSKTGQYSFTPGAKEGELGKFTVNK